MAKKTGADTPSAQLLAFAKERAKTAGNWMELHNAIFGIGAKFAELFPTVSARTLFVESEAHREIQQMMLALGKNGEHSAALEEAGGKFLLRLPKSIHAALILEAEQEGVSLNQLILSKVCLQLNALVTPK